MLDMLTVIFYLLVYAALIGAFSWSVMLPYDDYFEEAMDTGSKIQIARGIMAFWIIFLTIGFVVLSLGDYLGVGLSEALYRR